MTITAEEFRILMHTLGVEHRRKPYRNNYYAGSGHANAEYLESLIKKGLMEKRLHPINKDEWLYHATEEGIAAVTEARETAIRVARNQGLRMYMVFSRTAGAQEGALLVFAYSVQEARKAAWGRTYISDICDDQWTDVAATWIRNKDGEDEYLWSECLEPRAHPIESPAGCYDCMTWGNGPIGDDGLCPQCHDDKLSDAGEDDE